MRLNAACISLVYSKALRIAGSKDQQSEQTSGEIVTLARTLQMDLNEAQGLLKLWKSLKYPWRIIRTMVF